MTDVIWISAQGSKLNREGILETANRAQDLRDVVTTMCAALDRADILRALPDEQVELLRAELARRRVLVICDSLDQISDLRVRSLLDDLPHPTRVLATSTTRIDFGKSILVRPLDGSWSRRLACQIDRDSFDGLPPAQGEALLRACGGIPLAIAWSLALIGAGLDPEAVIDNLEEQESQLLRFCFEELWATLSADARELIAALALFPLGASRETIETIAGLRGQRASEALLELQDRALLETGGNDFTLLPLTRAYTSGRSNQERTARGHLWRRERWAEQIWLGVSAGLRLPSWKSAFPTLERQRIDIESVFAFASEEPDSFAAARAAVLWAETAYFFYSGGYWDTLFRHRDWAAPNLLEQGLFEEYLAANLNWVALALQLREEQEKREACFADAKRILLADDEDTDFHLAIIDFNRFAERAAAPDLKVRVSSLERVVRIFEARGEDQWQAMAANRLGNTPGLDDEYAEAAYKDAISIAEKHPAKAWAREQVGLGIGNLGIVANRSGEWRRALSLLTRAAPDITQVSDTATLNMELAIAQFNLGHIRTARKFGERALQQGRRLRLGVAISESDPGFEKEILPRLLQRGARWRRGGTSRRKGND